MNQANTHRSRQMVRTEVIKEYSTTMKAPPVLFPSPHEKLGKSDNADQGGNTTIPDMKEQ